MNEYLVTFKSTTAALRAKKAVDEAIGLEDILKDSAEVVPVPFSLSSTCFGMGLKCSASEEGVRNLYQLLVKECVDFKNFWMVGKEYTPCNQQLERM